MSPLLLLLTLAGASPDDVDDDADTYEDARLTAAAGAAGLSLLARDELLPGARIGFVVIVRHDVFTEDDPWPDVFNVAHVVTAEDVVARELLFATGDAYDPRLLEESARNLRDMFVFSLVRITPAKRTSDGVFGVLVFVRDLWSLRFEQGFQVTGASIDRLALALTERNVLGRAKAASVRFGLDPSSWSLGEAWLDRRVWGGALTATETVDVYFSRATGAFDGSAGGALVGIPLASFDQPWGFDVIALYDWRTMRQVQAGRVLTWDAPSTLDDVELVPRVWTQRDLDVEIAARRQWRAPLSLFVHRLSVGVGASDRFAAPHEEAAVPSALIAEFGAEVMPPVRRTLFPFVTYHVFSPRHRVYEDLDTVGQSEAVRLGPALSVSIAAGSKAALSSSDTVLVVGDVGVALDPWGGLVETAIEATARLEDGAVVNRALAARLRLATAPVFFGRLCLRGDVRFRKDDVANTLVSLGGDNGLRGYPSQAFFDFGASIAQGTVEWRSLPLEWDSVHLAFAAFYDTGSVFTSPGDAVPHHSVGIGARVLFPQFNRSVYRIDLAAPIDDLGVRVLFSFGDTQVVQHARPAFDRLAPQR